MSTHQGWLVMLSFILLSRSVRSYYQDNSWDSDIDDIDDLPNEAAAGNVNWKSNDDIYNSYPDNNKDVLLVKENPQLYLVTSMNRKRDNMARLTANKRMTTMNNSIKDANKVPGKPSLSIISPLEALQRKVAVVYNIRQKERNRGLLNDYGKRSVPNTFQVLEPEQNDAVLQSEIKQLKQVPHIQRRNFYGFYRVP